MATSKKVKEELDRFLKLQGDRVWLNQLWEELVELLAPERRGFIRPITDLRSTRMYDTQPIIAKRGLVNSIGSMLRPKTTAPGRWFDMVTDDEDLMEDREVKEWVDDSEKRLWNALYNPKAKFIQATGEADDDVVVLGTAALFTGVRKDRGGLLFKGFHMKGVYIALDGEGNVDTVYIHEVITARAAMQRWGTENLGEKTKEALDPARGNLDQLFPFLWSVKPRHDRDPRKQNNLNMPFLSLVIDMHSEHEVIEEGFEEMPFAIPRWDEKSSEIYSRSPGIMALPDIQTLNQMGKTMLRGIHRAVDPPWLLPSDSMVTAPNMNPGRVSYYDAKAIRNLGLTEPFQQMNSRGQINWGLDAQTAMREQIHTMFYRNVLNLPIGGPDMTATEVIERREEFIREIGAVFGQLEGSYNGPMVERAFNIMQRNNGFKPAPDVLVDRIINFRFASPIEKAKRQIEQAGIDQGISKILEVEQAHPEVANRVNWDEWAKFTAEAADFPPSLINDDVRVEEILDNQRAAAEEAKEMEDMERVIGATAQISNGGNVNGLEQLAA